MNRTDNYIVKDIAGEYLALPVTDSHVSLNSVVRLNETAYYIYSHICAGTSRENIVASFVGDFDIDIDTAKADIDECIHKLCSLGLIEL